MVQLLHRKKRMGIWYRIIVPLERGGRSNIFFSNYHITVYYKATANVPRSCKVYPTHRVFMKIKHVKTLKIKINRYYRTSILFIMPSFLPAS